MFCTALQQQFTTGGRAKKSVKCKINRPYNKCLSLCRVHELLKLQINVNFQQKRYIRHRLCLLTVRKRTRPIWCYKVTVKINYAAVTTCAAELLYGRYQQAASVTTVHHNRVHPNVP